MRFESSFLATSHLTKERFARSGHRTCCGARHRLSCRAGRFGQTALGGVPDSGERMRNSAQRDHAGGCAPPVRQRPESSAGRRKRVWIHPNGGDEMRRRSSFALTACLILKVVVALAGLSSCGGGGAPAREPMITPLGSREVMITPPGNRAPQAVGSIPAQTLTAGENASSVNVAPYFQDPDNDQLTYSASSNRPGALMAGMSGSTMTLTPVSAGATTVTVTAGDGQCARHADHRHDGAGAGEHANGHTGRTAEPACPGDQYAHIAGTGGRPVVWYKFRNRP